MLAYVLAGNQAVRDTSITRKPAALWYFDTDPVAQFVGQPFDQRVRFFCTTRYAVPVSDRRGSQFISSLCGAYSLPMRIGGFDSESHRRSGQGLIASVRPAVRRRRCAGCTFQPLRGVQRRQFQGALVHIQRPDVRLRRSHGQKSTRSAPIRSPDPEGLPCSRAAPGACLSSTEVPQVETGSGKDPVRYLDSVSCPRNCVQGTPYVALMRSAEQYCSAMIDPGLSAVVRRLSSDVRPCRVAAVGRSSPSVDDSLTAKWTKGWPVTSTRW